MYNEIAITCPDDAFKFFKTQDVEFQILLLDKITRKLWGRYEQPVYFDTDVAINVLREHEQQGLQAVVVVDVSSTPEAMEVDKRTFIGRTFMESTEIELLDVLLVNNNKYASACCHSKECCPEEGKVSHD